MPAHVNILEGRESLRNPLLVSLLMHGLVFSSIALYATLGNRGRVLWGDPHSLGGGGSVGITAVAQIPLPARSGAANPLANDTESRVPRPPQPLPKPAAKAPEPDAIPLRGRKLSGSEKRERMTADMFRPQPQKRNQLYSSAGQALSSNMFGAQTGTGGVGVGPGSAFGSKYAWYRDLLEQRIAQKWRTGDVDPRIQTAPPVIITFEILRNGSVRNVRILTGSGNGTLDNSAQRAVYDAAPFPALPADYERNSAQIEIWFQLKR